MSAGLGLSLAAIKFLEGYTIAAKKNQQDKQKLEKELAANKKKDEAEIGKRLTSLSKAPDGSPLSNWVDEQQRNLALDPTYVVDFSQAKTLSSQAPEESFASKEAKSLIGETGDRYAAPAENEQKVLERVYRQRRDIGKQEKVVTNLSRRKELEESQFRDVKSERTEYVNELEKKIDAVESKYIRWQEWNALGKDKVRQEMYLRINPGSSIPTPPPPMDIEKAKQFTMIYEQLMGRPYKENAFNFLEDKIAKNYNPEKETDTSKDIKTRFDKEKIEFEAIQVDFESAMDSLNVLNTSIWNLDITNKAKVD